MVVSVHDTRPGHARSLRGSKHFPGLTWQRHDAAANATVPVRGPRCGSANECVGRYLPRHRRSHREPHTRYARAIDCSGPWYQVRHPLLSRLRLTCYGPETPPVAEIEVDASALSDEVYATIGEIGAAVISRASDRSSLDVRACADVALREKSAGDLVAQSPAISCLVRPGEKTSMTLSVTITTAQAQPAAAGAAIRKPRPQMAKRSEQGKPCSLGQTKAPSRHVPVARVLKWATALARPRSARQLGLRRFGQHCTWPLSRNVRQSC